MQRKLKTSSRHLPGVTLVEVLGGLVLLGTLLTGLLLAKSQAQRQYTDAGDKLEAIELADRLLTEWFSRPDHWPRDDTGPIDGHEDLRWRTETVSDEAARELGLERVRLTITESTGSNQPLTSVEVLIPTPAPEGSL